MQVKDKVAIVTGGSNGIGAALCRKLSQKKARAVVVADIDVKGAQTLADEIGGLAIQCDVDESLSQGTVLNLFGEPLESIEPTGSPTYIITTP